MSASAADPHSACTTLYVGLGNDLRSDDGVGPYIAEKLSELPGIDAKNAGSRPERAIDWALESRPGALVFLDAADFGGSPGEVRELPVESLSSAAFSTHRLPLPLIIGWIESETGARCRCLGIQPLTLAFGEGLSPAVQDAAEALIQVLAEESRTDGSEAEDSWK